MLQELAARTGASLWAIGSMLFFLAVWLAVVVWVARKRPEEIDALARLPLDDEGQGKGHAPSREPQAVSREPHGAGPKP